MINLLGISINININEDYVKYNKRKKLRRNSCWFDVSVEELFINREVLIETLD